jgi:enamine deaminase RidA (YjgF/YER057c/UK114 family)
MKKGRPRLYAKGESAQSIRVKLPNKVYTWLLMGGRPSMQSPSQIARNLILAAYQTSRHQSTRLTKAIASLKKQTNQIEHVEDSAAAIIKAVGQKLDKAIKANSVRRK